LYLLFRYVSKEYVNLLLSTYFACVGIGALVNAIQPILAFILPFLKKPSYHLLFESGVQSNI